MSKTKVQTPEVAAPPAVRKGRHAPVIRLELQNEIESGTLSPGTVLDERGLAERFGVSRTPVREALRQLSMIGLVKMTPNIGTTVARRTFSEIRAMLEYVSEMEPVCAKLAARRIGPELSARLEQAIEQCRAHALDGAQYRLANAGFHEAIYDGCHNQVLADQIRLIRRVLRRYRVNEYQSQSNIQRSIEDHIQIAKAIIAGDERRATEAMMKHLPAGGGGFSEFMAKVPRQFFGPDSQD